MTPPGAPEAVQLDALVRGCTHYPLLHDLMAAEVADGVPLIDSAEATAAAVERALDANRVRAPKNDAPPRHRFVVSDAPEHFRTLGSRFLGRPIEALEHHVFT